MTLPLRDWLSAMALDRYAELFEAHGIGPDTIARFNEADLRALGVSIGDCRRLLRVIEPPEQRGPLRTGGPLAERRWMTVLFCDLAGSTELSDRLDPEELRDIFALYQDRVAGAILRYKGHVGSLYGDGIVAYFGWPRAHEDQAECAIRGGLAALEAVAGLQGELPIRLHARVGISTGQVVISDLVGQSISRAELIVGRTPNLAARLQGAGGEDEILIDEATRHEVGRRFALAPLPPLRLKGLAEPVTAWRVIRAETWASRFDARQAPRGSLVGRDVELATLHELWAKVCRGSGQVVLLSGEPGIGKSSLLAALCERLALDASQRSWGQCSPLHADTPLHPVIRQLEQWLGFQASDTDAARLEKLALRLGPCQPDEPHATALLAGLLSLPTGGLPPLPDEPPAQQRGRLLSLLLTLVLRAEERGPVLVVLEDAQWVDATTRELALRLIGAIADRPFLVIVTQRDPFGPEWPSAANVTRLELDRLDDATSTAVVRAAAGARLDEALMRRIIARAEGVPLFLEEVTRAVIERRAKRTPAALASDATDDFVPPSLQASLTSRIDHLDAAKGLAQIGAVIGRQFPLALLAAVAECPIDGLAAEIEALLHSELVTIPAESAERTLAFKHALVQEAAYSGLLLADRRRLHRAVLDHLERLYPAQAEAMPEALATHAERAEDWDRAVRYLAGACIKAVRRFANREAISLYHRAAAALAHLPPEAVAMLPIDLRLHAFSAFHAVGDNDRLVVMAREAAILAERSGDSRRIAATYHQSAFAHWMTGEHDEALARGEASLAMARALGDFSLMLSALFILANTHHARGDIARAVELHREIIGMLPGDLATKRFGWSGAPSLYSRAFLGWCLVELGRFGDAWQSFVESRRLLGSADQPFAKVVIETGVGLYHLRRREFEPAIAILRETLELSRAAEVLTMYPMVAACLGSALTGAGRTAEALAVLSDPVEQETYRFGCKYTWLHLRLALAETRRRLGDLDAANAELRLAIELARDCREMVHYAHALKLEADFRLADGAPAAARRAYAETVAIAEPRGIAPLVAHGTLGLARCAEQDGDPAEAARLLGEARRAFARLGLAVPASPRPD